MCKYCMKIYTRSDNIPEALHDEENGFLISGIISADEEDKPELFITINHEHENVDYGVKIHYCPFCGQKLDLVEVET